MTVDEKERGKEKKDMLYCRYCGTPLEEGDLYCTGCGKPVANTEDIHMMPGSEPVRQGSLDPTNPDRVSERNAGGGGLYYGEKGSSGGMDEGEDPDPGNNRIAVIIAGIAVAVIVCAFFLLLTGGLSRKEKGSGEEETAARQESGSDQEDIVSGPGGSGQADDDGVNPDAGEGSGQTKEEVPAVEPAGQEQIPASSEAEDDKGKDGTEAAPAGEQSDKQDRQQPEQADLEKAADTPLDQHKKEAGTQEKDEAQNRAAEEKNKKNPSGEENLSGVDSAEKLKEEPVDTAGSDSSYILADSDKRNYSREELSRLDDYSLQMAINELYARHGRKFKTPEVQEYFEGKSWYNGTVSPEEFDGNEDAYFNNYELKNRELMAKIRDERAASAGQR